MKKLISLFVLCALSSQLLCAKNLKILAIGNSFSQDAVEQHLYQLAAAQGDTLVIGNAYIPGCEINLHLANLLNDNPAYSYRKVVDGVKHTTDHIKLKDIITDENWQIISLQQASHYSGKRDTYTKLDSLRELVTELMPLKDTPIVWHMTWSYSKDSDHGGYKYYANNQQTMDDSIYSAVKNIVIPLGITQIIPSGPAITNGRKIFGDVMNIDGYHLSHDLGRYIAACVWCEFLTGKSIIGNPYFPSNLTRKEALGAQKAAHKAVKKWGKLNEGNYKAN